MVGEQIMNIRVPNLHILLNTFMYLAEEVRNIADRLMEIKTVLTTIAVGLYLAIVIYLCMKILEFRAHRFTTASNLPVTKLDHNSTAKTTKRNSGPVVTPNSPNANRRSGGSGMVSNKTSYAGLASAGNRLASTVIDPLAISDNMMVRKMSTKRRALITQPSAPSNLDTIPQLTPTGATTGSSPNTPGCDPTQQQPYTYPAVSGNSSNVKFDLIDTSTNEVDNQDDLNSLLSTPPSAIVPSTIQWQDEQK